MQVPPSPLFAGRERELGQLRAALEESRSGAARMVLVTADAGAGKTRLLREFTAPLATDATLLAGGCTEQTEAGLPFAPVSAAIRRLVRERGAASVTDLVGPASAGDLAWLLPEFGAPRSLPDPAVVRSRLFEVVRLLLERLAQDRPVILILEDMHWADAGSRDLLRFLTANLAEVPVLIVVTARACGDVPTRALMAELSRTPFARALVLPRLARSEVAQQLRGILGHEPETTLLNAVFARGDGIPLFTEFLVADADDGAVEVPTTVQELLLRAVRSLPLTTRQRVQALSLAGGVLRPQLLAAVEGISVGAVETQLQPAVDAFVVQPRDEGYVFRHELIREAVASTLTPAERRRLHAAYASALETHPDWGSPWWIAVALARHWQEAGEAGKTLEAARRGAAEAEMARSQPTRLEMLETMLGQWTRLPDAAAVVGASQLDVLEQAADAACWSALPQRGLVHAEAALAIARSEGDTERNARLLLQRAPMRQQLAVPGQEEDLVEALALSAALPSVRIEALGQACRAALARGRWDDAAARATELAAAARASGDEAGQLDARIMAAVLAGRRGKDSTRELEELVARCRLLDSGWLECFTLNAIAEGHLGLGRPGQAAEAAARAGRRCIEVGQWGYQGAAVAQVHGRALHFAGRLDEALEVIGQALDSDPAPFGRAQLLLCRGTIAAQRGDLDAAAFDLDQWRKLPPGQAPRPLAAQALALDIAWAQGNGPQALPQTGAFDAAALHAHPQEGWPALARAVRLFVDVAQPNHAFTLLRPLIEGLAQPGPVERAWAALVACECARAQEHRDAARWLGVAAAWAELGHAWEQAYALMRAAATEPSRGVASAHLTEAAALANRLGARPLLQRVAVVAQRRRVRLDDEAAAARPPSGLTEREVEVLKLLAEGKTNRQIASALVISAKTASVHVTNILTKLDVHTRGAAAAVAYRLGLAGPT
ncbi:MAG: AAA family ATPase [Proteobacteria bacterium]|nr:AAA family ATPase [Pseudomonadota bacterium]